LHSPPRSFTGSRFNETFDGHQRPGWTFAGRDPDSHKDQKDAYTSLNQAANGNTR